MEVFTVGVWSQAEARMVIGRCPCYEGVDNECEDEEGQKAEDGTGDGVAPCMGG